MSASLPTGVSSPAATLVVERLFLSTDHNFVGHHGGPAGTEPTVEVNALECVAGRGVRGESDPPFYGAYVRDPEGNKFCAYFKG